MSSTLSVASFIMREAEEACGCLFFQVYIEEPVYKRLFHIILYWILIQTNIMIMKNFILQTLSVLNNLLNE